MGPKYGLQLMGLLAAKERDARVLEAVLQDLLSSGATVHPTTLEPLLRAYAHEGNYFMALDVLENFNGSWGDCPQQPLACLALSVWLLSHALERPSKRQWLLECSPSTSLPCLAVSCWTCVSKGPLQQGDHQAAVHSASARVLHAVSISFAKFVRLHRWPAFAYCSFVVAKI